MIDKRALYEVPFLCGDGSEKVMLKVLYIADGFPRDAASYCAFCHGDPGNEAKVKGNLIAAYFKRNPRAETCPCCNGRPS